MLIPQRVIDLYRHKLTRQQRTELLSCAAADRLPTNPRSGDFALSRATDPDALHDLQAYKLVRDTKDPKAGVLTELGKAVADALEASR